MTFCVFACVFASEVYVSTANTTVKALHLLKAGCLSSLPNLLFACTPVECAFEPLAFIFVIICVMLFAEYKVNGRVESELVERHCNKESAI